MNRNIKTKYSMYSLNYWFSFFLLFSLLLISCGDGKPTGSGGDNIPPSVISTNPVDSASNVTIDAAINVTFSEPVDSLTITPSTFFVDNNVTGNYSFNGNSVTLTPSNSLAYTTEYTATITTAVTDTAGNKLVKIHSWIFTTEEDPSITPPEVLSTSPANGALDVAVDILITAVFSKDMNPSTITPASFTISNGITGMVTYANRTATFTPDIPLDYDTSYSATITTAVTDTFGNNLPGNHIWSFSTPSLIPQATIFSPSDSVIIGDSAVVRVLTSHPIGVDSVQVFVDGSYSGTGTLNGNTTDYSWDATGSIPGSEHIIFAKAFASGNVGFSDTILVFYQWEELISDFNDPWMTDISKVLARSTDSTLELRYEFWEPWFDPYDTIPDDTTLDLGIYFDTDQNQLTGRTDFATIPLNDIGAEYRIIIGLHGWDTALAVWNVNVVPSFWDKVYDPNGFVSLYLPANDKVLEFGVRWADLNNTSAVNIVSINVFWQSTSSFAPDWVPEQDNGHITIIRDNRYLGKSSVRKTNAKLHPGQNHQRNYINPF